MTVVEMYVNLIHMGIKTIDDVPEMIKEQVKEILKDDPASIKNNNNSVGANVKAEEKTEENENETIK